MTALLLLCLCAPPIIDLDPQSFNTWLSGRFIEPESEFERIVERLEERDVEVLFKGEL